MLNYHRSIYRPFFSHRQDEEDAEQTDVPEERSGEVTLNAESEEAWFRRCFKADPFGTEGLSYKNMYNASYIMDNANMIYHCWCLSYIIIVHVYDISCDISLKKTSNQHPINIPLTIVHVYDISIYITQKTPKNIPWTGVDFGPLSTRAFFWANAVAKIARSDARPVDHQAAVGEPLII